MTNAVGKADVPWWATPRYARPEIHDPAIALVADELRRSADLETAVGRAVRHIIWAIGWRARRDERGIQVSLRYVANGADVSPSTAAIACRRIADIICAERSRGAWWTLSPEAEAACWDLTADWIHEMPEPAVSRSDDDENMPVVPCGPIELPPKSRGKTHCPCGRHANGDRHPSLIFDRTRGIATCMTTGAVIVFDPASGGNARIVRWTWDGSLPDELDPDLNRDRSNPTQGIDPVAPGRADPAPRPRGRILAGTLTGRRRGPFVLTSLRRSIRDRSEDDLVRTLRGSDRAFGGPRSQERAEAAAIAIQAFGPAEGPTLIPDRFWSVDRWFVEWTRREGARGAFSVPDMTTARNAGSGVSLLDLDSLDDAPTDPDADVAARIRRAVRRASGGRLRVEAIVATSRTGMQVAVAWDRFWPDTAALYRDPGARRTLDATARAVLDVLGRGGAPDPSAWAPGRYGRRPGWRVGKDGHAVRARLWWAAS